MRALVRSLPKINFCPDKKQSPDSRASLRKPCPFCHPDFIIPTAQLECLARDAKQMAERHNDYVDRTKSMAITWQHMTTMLGEGEVEELDAILHDLREKLEFQQEKRYLHELNNEQPKAKGKDPSSPDQGV